MNQAYKGTWIQTVDGRMNQAYKGTWIQTVDRQWTDGWTDG